MRSRTNARSEGRFAMSSSSTAAASPLDALRTSSSKRSDIRSVPVELHHPVGDGDGGPGCYVAVDAEIAGGAGNRGAIVARIVVGPVGVRGDPGARIAR